MYYTMLKNELIKQCIIVFLGKKIIRSLGLIHTTEKKLNSPIHINEDGVTWGTSLSCLPVTLGKFNEKTAKMEKRLWLFIFF